MKVNRGCVNKPGLMNGWLESSLMFGWPRTHFVLRPPMAVFEGPGISML